VDKKYEKLEKEGQLTSAPWAKNLPWTNEAAATYKSKEAVKKDEPVKKQAEPEPKKKGLFGW